MEVLAKISSAAWWAAALVIVCLMVCLIFHRSLDDLIRRIVNVKTSRFDLQAPQPSGLSGPAAATAQLSERSPESPTADGEANDSPEPVDVLSRLAKAFEARDLEAMAQLRVEFKEAGKNDAGKAENDASYLAFCSVAGDAQAMEELKRRCNDGSPYAIYAMLKFAWALSEMNQPAQDAYRRALSVAGTDTQKAMAATGLAHEIEKSGQWEEATGVLADALDCISDATERVRLLDALAATAKRHKQNFLAVIALEESVALNPEDTHNLFELGYCADDAGLSGLSAAAHEQLLVITPEDADALHNLSVALVNLSLPALAVEHYEQSSRLGNTLADANLAYMLINAGFTSIARDRLQSALKGKDVDGNVYKALTRLEDVEKTENETLRKVLEQARKSADQLIKFSQNLFSDHKDATMEGSWSEPGEAPFQLAVTNGNIAGQYVVDKHSWKIVGHGDFAGGGRVDVTQIDSPTHPHLSGYVCLEPDGLALRLVVSDTKGELTFFRFTRVPATAA